MKQQWDIFCSVIDNYGDIGVTWRLARQLTEEYGVQVRVWLDDVAALASIWTGVDEKLDLQLVDNIQVCAWLPSQDWTKITPAQVLIQAFACALPEGYIAQMLKVKNRTGIAPHWFNLEYLSAEQWVDDCHAMQSPQSNGLKKTFFFPGFSEKTGGLLRERDLFTLRNQALNDDWAHLTGFVQIEGALKVVLFGYDHMPLTQWLPLVAQGDKSVQLAVTSGKAARAMRAACAQLGQPVAGWGNLSIRELPMVRQNMFDRLLWAADVNFVRGEDSFIRAIWAAKPFVWQIYPQDDGVHFTKLKAFVERYRLCDGQSSEATEAWQDVQLAWNGDSTFNLGEAWTRLCTQLPLLKQHAQRYTQDLARFDDLAQQLTRQVRQSHSDTGVNT
ncbi:elongation factor P maturation arginine rhamnosyltransferase EarP [Hydromonas duriensis]|uniref:Protein-arginine rhamnosyltransferase n=1 Tax=Hydromonas duriensis TaxID=1527608 RepID=A0A4R6Y8D4_9BURK|nr:elongation factor P maturation arginine rhamnosyltransferase EarP [Hydromonas duriensis]TDR31638.1 putative repeat protein (TIGR03837 family) [Hydromonas duriensis]